MTFLSLTREGYLAEYEAIMASLGEARSVALARRALDDATMHPPCRRTWLPLLGRVFGPAMRPLIEEAVEQGLTDHLELAPPEARPVNG